MRSAWASLGALALGGCLHVNAPPADLASREVSRPDRFAAATQPVQAGAVRDDWMAEFADPTLLALADEAMRNNPDLRAAAARWEEARARVRVASSFLWPQLNAVAGASRVGTGVPAGAGAPATYNQYNVGGQVDWEVDLWGRVRSDERGAAALAAANALDYESARLSIAAAVADAWFVAIQARLQLTIDRDRLEAEERTAKITGDKVRVGVGGPLEAELAEANVRLAADAVQRDEQAIAETTKALEALLGRYPASELAVASALPPPPGEAPVGVPSELLERRPDVAAADRRVAAAFHFTESARAARLPRVTLSASLGTLINPSERIWSIGTNLLAPLFTGGRLAAEIEVATAQQRQTLAGYVGVAIAAFREVESALANEQYLARREAELGRATERLRNASRVGENRYDAGVMSIVELNVIRQQDFAARALLLQVKTNRLRERLRLYQALGGAFDAAAAAPTGSAGAADEARQEKP